MEENTASEKPKRKMSSSKNIRSKKQSASALLKRRSILRRSLRKRKPTSKLRSSIHITKRDMDAQSLPWKRINPTLFSQSSGKFGLDEGGGLLEFEELDGVEVVYEDLPGNAGSKKAVFKMRENSDDKVKKPSSSSEDSKVLFENSSAFLKMQEALDLEFDDSLNPGFSDYHLHQSIKRALYESKFENATPIQKSAWEFSLSPDVSINERDIIGIAETGSGKTLAYSIPILQKLLESSTEGLQALILVPTRELALQVKSHISDIIHKASSLPSRANDKGKAPEKPCHFAKVVAICGGMSIEKQRRILTEHGGPHIIIATPGRLWDIIQEGTDISNSIKTMKYLVLDEADRMIESGHFQEMRNILQLTRRGEVENQFPVDMQTDQEEDGVFSANKLTTTRSDMRTFIFSATMSKMLQLNLRKAKNKYTKKTDLDNGQEKLLGELLNTIDFRDADPVIVDLTPKGGTVSGLQECKISCLNKEKELYLYYILTKYPGRTLIFVSAIDTIRRIKPIFELLRFDVSVAHSDLQQKARLKSFEKFRSSKNGILIATDVAARGLDIPEVDHVIHYQLPRSADTYLHRSGRTARGGKEGLSLQMCSPEEKQLQRSILKALNKTPGDIKDLPIEYSIFDQLRRRLDMARDVDKIQHKLQKETYEENWYRKTAEAMDIEVDSMDETSGQLGSKKRAKKFQSELRHLKMILGNELDTNLKVKGLSLRYITSNSQRDFVTRLINGEDHDTVLGMKKSTALEDAKHG